MDGAVADSVGVADLAPCTQYIQENAVKHCRFEHAMPDLTANTVVQAVLHTVRDFATNQIVDAMLQNLEVKDTVPASGLS